MKKEKAWILQKIQALGIADNTQYPAGNQVIFTSAAPYIPVFSPNGKDSTALCLVRHEEAWWVINHSDDLCCAVNEQVVAPSHRMRLNDGDTLEWGLSSWRLIRNGEEFSPNVPLPQPTQSSASGAEYLDLDWFKKQQIHSQNPFDIIPSREVGFSGSDEKTENPLHQLYQEYQQALQSPEQEYQPRTEPFTLNEEVTGRDLASLYERKTYADTLLDMVAGAPGIDAILDTLDTTGEGDMSWLAAESLPDILHLLSPEQTGKVVSNETLPDLTRREHRIIGIDSHYRITPTEKNGVTAHEKN